MTRLETAFAAIDQAANSADPNLTDGQPNELLYGQRMTAEQDMLYPGAADPLRITCRGQHIERWTLPRHDFAMDRPGYLVRRTNRAAATPPGWPKSCARPASGRSSYDIQHAEKMLMKQVSNATRTQAPEDVACFTFIRWYMGPFSQTRDPDEMLRIVEKTARKMSPMARARALTEFAIPEPFAAAFRD